MSVDVVGIYDADFNQLFVTAGNLKLSVKEPSKLMEHPLEDGSKTVDHRILEPIDVMLSMVLPASDYRTIYQQIKDLRNRGVLLIVQTRVTTYTSMMIADMPHEETPDMIDAIPLALSLHEVVFQTPAFTAVKVRQAKHSSTVKRGQQQPGEPPKQAGSVAGDIWGGLSNLLHR